MATDVERLIVRLEASQTKFERQLAAANRAANKQARAIEGRFAAMNKHIGASIGGAARGWAAGLAASLTVRGLVSLSDAATKIDNALKIAGLSGAELEKVYGRLRDSAVKNAAPFESLVDVFSRASLVQKELGVSTEELLGFTDRVALALRVQGKSAEETQGALLQLGQALSTGTVRAEEYNSLQEGAPAILRAVAAGLKEAGGSVGTLTNLVKTGQVSSQAFFRAFEAGAPILEDKVSSAQFTVSQAMGNLRTALIDTAREFNSTTNAGSNLANGINTLAGTISDFDVSGFIDKIAEARGAVETWLNEVGNADVFKNLSQMLGITDADGNMLNIDAKAAKEEATSLERQVKLLQDTIEKNTSLGFDNKDALAQLDAVQSKLAVVKASLAGMSTLQPTMQLGEITVNGGVSDGRGYAVGTPGDPNAIAQATPGVAKVKPVSLADYPVKPKSGGGNKRTPAEKFDRDIEQIKARTAAINAETEAQASINPLIEDYGYAVQKAGAKQDLLNAAKRAGLKITPDLKASIEKLAEGYAQASAEAGRLAESQDRIRQRAEEFNDLARDTLGGFIHDLEDGKSAADALGDALKNIGDRLLDMALNDLFKPQGSGAGGLLGSLFGGLFGGSGGFVPNWSGGLYHTGGVVGSPKSSRSVPASTFAGAPRYHDGGIAGLKPGEVPAILQKGEVVIPRGGDRASSGAITYAPVYNVAQGADPAAIAELRQAQAQDRAAFQSKVVKSIQDARKHNVKI